MILITNLTKRKIPKIPWEKIKEEVLGKKYELSLVFGGNALMKKLNKTYRGKNKAASVLSFPLSKKSEAPRLPSTSLRTSRSGQSSRLRSGQGEIFINFSQKEYFPLYLFIHALLHLKGFEHNARMEVRTQQLIKKYGEKYSYRA